MSNVFPQMHTKKCEYLKIPCVHSECGMMVKKSALQEHLENECICRRQKCDYCKKGVKLNLMEVIALDAPIMSKFSQLTFNYWRNIISGALGTVLRKTKALCLKFL